ncbi:hypothetical protein [Plastoroseomonas hellenica]|uniref:hypothetical protein n=1 Tax=Plastoroseomonas hellenica TaxID=2687306 RepID=UPI001BA6A8E7|nr:hypothetical protein [Plastoroseomonas hellenica]MBR0641207.1 hypothetical protein [Plastoroseomonas hellenica]
MFGLSGAEVVRFALNGPEPDGAQFLAVFQAGGAKYEQMLVNSIGPVELWVLSTTLVDTALRNRVTQRLGFSEGLRRLVKVFPRGSAAQEFERRKDERLRCGESDGRAGGGRRH